MQGPAVDLVLLALLVLFFGIQQRGHRERHYRFWFAGWIFVFLSYALWELRLSRPLPELVREALCFDLVLLGVLLFVISFVADAPRLWRVVGMGLVPGIPSVVAFDMGQIASVPVRVLVAAVVVWHVYGIYAALVLLPREWRLRRRLIVFLCAVYGAAFVLHLLVGNRAELQDWVLAELVLCSAALYGTADEPLSFSGILGTVGFAAWGAFYLMDAGRSYNLISGPMHWLAQFWNVPKYCVGFSMILQMSEDAHTEMTRYAQGYRQLYEDFRLLYEEHPHPMCIYEPETGLLLSANPAAQSTYGYAETEWVGMPLTRLELPRDADWDAMEAVFPPPPDGRRARHRRSDGTPMWVNVYERDVIFQGRAARMVLSRDVTAQLNSSVELVRRAHMDALTGLPNRHDLEGRIDACLARSVRDQRKAVVLTIDVDHFKQVNDTYGHLTGDECLKAVAARLQSRIRSVDTLARTGGEEFTAVIGGLAHADDAMKIAVALLRIFDEPMPLPDCDIGVSISIGAAVFPDDGPDRQTLLRRSDEALYEAKRRGRNTAVTASEMVQLL